MNSYMKRTGYSGLSWGVLSLIVLWVSFGATVQADTFNSTNFTIDASNVGHSVGGAQSSTSYKLVSAGGESVIGNGTGGSYKLGEGYVSQLEKSFQLTTQPSNLLGAWSFEEGVGTRAYDNSANLNNGELRDGPTWGTGKVGGGLTLDGTNDRVVVDNPDTFSYTGGNMTISAWVNISASDTGVSYIASKPWNSNYNYFIYIGAGRDIALYVASPGAVSGTVYAATTLASSTWTHITGVLKADKSMEIYINGALSNTSSHTITNWADGTDSHLPLQIGCLFPFAAGWVGNAGQCLNGSVDEVKIYSRALTAKEIDAEYDAHIAGNPTGLSLNAVTPGVSQTAAFDVVSQTDAPGYNLSINQNQNLTSGGNSISGVSGSIASPVTWSEASTKGLGFTLFGTNATAIPGLWSSGNAYAALPGSATSFYTRTGYTAGAKDVLNMRLRLDVNTSQPAGDYTNQMTITGTMTP
jgi:hypothetical protein